MLYCVLMASDGLKLDAYVRVSKVAGRSGSSFISPEVQSQQIERWAQAHGHTLSWHEPELDVSGGSMSRPVFDRSCNGSGPGRAMA